MVVQVVSPRRVDAWFDHGVEVGSSCVKLHYVWFVFVCQRKPCVCVCALCVCVHLCVCVGLACVHFLCVCVCERESA